MLSDLQVKSAKPKEKYYMLRDDRGLYLRVDTSGRILDIAILGKQERTSNFTWPVPRLVVERRAKIHTGGILKIMFRKAERRKAKLRLAITGPAGSGKTARSGIRRTNRHD